MRLFDKLFGKGHGATFEDSDVVSPVKGEMIPAEKIKDSVFAQQMMGQTIGIIPEDGTIVSPVNGIVSVVFPTGHAYGIRTNEGVSYLVHIGINTVNLNGKGFHSFVTQGDTVMAGQELALVDIESLKNNNYDTTVVLAVTERPTDDFKIQYIKNQFAEKAQKINI